MITAMKQCLTCKVDRPSHTVAAGICHACAPTPCGHCLHKLGAHVVGCLHCACQRAIYKKQP